MSKNKIAFNFFIFTFLSLFLFGCSTIPTSKKENDSEKELKKEIYTALYLTNNLPVEYLCPSTLEWKPLTKKGKKIDGFMIMQHKIKEINVSWTCVKVDLDTEGLKIVASPSPENLGISPPLFHVKEFAKKNDAIVAINATPWENKSYPNDAVGIVKIDGIQYFPPVEKYSALAFSENPLRAKIFESQNSNDLENYNYAFGGFFQVLKDGEVISFNKNRRSRVAVGTNKEGQELYIFVVTSLFSPKDKNGFTFEECAIVLKQLGCTDAMHFDGGHSSCLVINEKDFQKPLLNRKIPIAIGIKK